MPISDAPRAEYMSADKQRMVVDSHARRSMVDSYRLFLSLRVEAGTRARLDGIILSELRRELAAHATREIVGIERERIMETVAATVDTAPYPRVRP